MTDLPESEKRCNAIGSKHRPGSYCPVHGYKPPRSPLPESEPIEGGLSYPRDPDYRDPEPDSETPERCPTCGSDDPAKCDNTDPRHSIGWPHPHEPRHCCPDPFHSPDPPPIPSSDQERCGGSGWLDINRRPYKETHRNPMYRCPGCPDCKPESSSDPLPIPTMDRADCVRVARVMADDDAVEPELRLFARSALQWLEVEGDFADFESE